MAIQHRISVENGVLHVKASGFDENADDVKRYGLSVIAACQHAGLTRVLCDERALEYRIDVIDTYATGILIAEAAPKIARIAIVCKPANMEDALFWEDVVVNRGLTLKVFTDIERAQEWLCQPDKPE